MSSIEVRPFRRSDRDQLTGLVNAHAAAVVPGSAASVAAVLSHLERQPGEFIVDPWVSERLTLVAEQRQRVAAAAHLLRYASDERVSQAYRNAGEISWLLFWPEGPRISSPCWTAGTEAAEMLIAAAIRQLEERGVWSQGADGDLPVPGVAWSPQFTTFGEYGGGRLPGLPCGLGWPGPRGRWLICRPAVAPGEISRGLGWPYVPVYYLLVVLGLFLLRAWRHRQRGQTIREGVSADRAQLRHRRELRQAAREAAAALPWLTDKRQHPTDWPGVIITPAPEAPGYFPRWLRRDHRRRWRPEDSGNQPGQEADPAAAGDCKATHRRRDSVGCAPGARRGNGIGREVSPRIRRRDSFGESSGRGLKTDLRFGAAGAQASPQARRRACRRRRSSS